MSPTPPPRSAWLGWLRDRWLHQPLPMIVEHHPGAAESLCAAPSMWMQARVWANALREQGARPNDTVRFSGPPGADWISAFVATIRVRGCFVPDPVECATRFLLRPERSPLVYSGGARAPCGIRLLDGFIEEAALLSLGQAAGVEAGEQLLCPSDWARREIFLQGPLAAMVCGAEILIGPLSPARDWLARTGSRPDRVIARPDVHARLYPHRAA